MMRVSFDEANKTMFIRSEKWSAYYSADTTTIMALVATLCSRPNRETQSALIN